jgi:arsenate reductase
LKLLGMDDPRDLMRKNEAAYAENGLDDPELTMDALVNTMIQNPVLIQRPIVVANGKAVIGRPPENVLSLLGLAPVA